VSRTAQVQCAIRHPFLIPCTLINGYARHSWWYEQSVALNIEKSAVRAAAAAHAAALTAPFERAVRITNTPRLVSVAWNEHNAQ
jgi:hypothetical protein